MRETSGAADEDDGARAWFDDGGRSTRDSEDGSRLWVTMGAWRMRKMAASHAWSEGASEDEGARAMAMMAAQDRCCETTGRTNHAMAWFPFKLFPFVFLSRAWA